MSPQERMLIEHECSRLALRLALLTDQREFAAAADCFTVDASFCRPLQPQQVLQGRARILESFAQKSPGDSAQHCCTNILVDVVDEHHATGTLYFTVYAERTPQEGSPAGPQRLVFVGAYHDRYRRTAEGWRIQARTGTVRYRFDAFPTTC